MIRTRLLYGHASHQGLVRKQNQDSHGKFPRDHTDPHAEQGVLFIVADGMGGHQGGREASQMAVHLVEHEFFSNPEVPVQERLGRALERANGQIYERAQQEELLSGMGTTCSALHIEGDQATLAHVGDSRIYCLVGGDLEQLTTDHRKIEELVNQLGISEEEAQKYTRKNALSRALGVRPEVQVDLATTSVAPGQIYLLCSDGLLDVPTHEMVATLVDHEPQLAADLLVKQANDTGGKDNVTVQVIHVESAPEPEAAPVASRGRSLWIVGIVLLVLLLVVLVTALS